MLRLRTRHPLATLPVLALALALHGLVAWLLSQRAPPAAERLPAPAMRVALRWLPPSAPPMPPAPPPQSAEPVRAGPRISPPSKRPSPAARAAPGAPRATPPTAPVATRPAEGEPAHGAPMQSAAPATPQASSGQAAGAAQPSLLDSAATRRAIREAALAPSLAALEGTSAPVGPAQRLGSAIAAGGLGDCDKGEFAGGGMGLLSLPFWAIAKLRDRCGR